ncbi:YggT family protein [Luteibacter anthropi]|uniref:YggT family protein n=1 Tax=Luteibacter anthropi TaxID=564369 RepID=A0A7X5ZJ74_9GAMM|nr:YggT family protein [Luteibacter anthropi]NII07683.1 YggT family protein [Luteibacter anthropi]URX60981.1 YggT family protein [Luteibacter anthropi]
MNYLTNAGALILQFAFGALVTLFVLRILAEACRADFHNPICQFIYRFTNPVLRPLRKALPNFRRINTGALVIALVLECVKVLLVLALGGIPLAPVGILVMGFAELLDFFLLTWIVIVFAWSLMSMFSSDRYHPVARLLSSLAEPLVRPLRGRMTIGGLDFSPTVVLLGLFLARILVAQPILDLGGRLVLAG